MIIESVNVGRTVPVPWGRMKRSAIDKRAVAGPVRIHRDNVEGDEIADLKHHGGLEQAVYAFAGEDIDVWSGEIGRRISPGEFGENLTTRGVDINEARLGERWQIGSALLEVSGVRIPCAVFGGFIDERQWVKRFTTRGRPGAYLRVIVEGSVSAGDEITVVERRNHDLTVGFAFHVLTTGRSRAAELLAEPRISERVRKRATSE